MTQTDDLAGYQNHPKWMDDERQRPDELDSERPSPERARTASEVGSAIAHQLNGPLTALRLYVGEIRQNSRQPQETTGTQDGMQEIIELAFEETERVCAMIS